VIFQQKQQSTTSYIFNFFSTKSGIAVLFILSVLFTFAVRTWVCERELSRVYKKTGANFAPYSVESSIMHDYARAVASGKGIPEYDSRLGPMSNVPLKEQMSLGLEYYLGWTYRLKNLIFSQPELSAEDTVYEDDPYFTNYCRHALRLWFCLATGFIFLWLLALRCPWYFALCGVVLHTISPAAIARYTGQDILRGNFALPFIVATFLLGAWVMRKNSPVRLLLMGGSAFCAVAFWDVSQLWFSLWAVAELIRLVVCGRFSKRRIALWTTLYISLVLAAILVPYCRAHKLLLSPLLMVLIPSLLAAGWFSMKSKIKSRIAVLIGIVLFFLIWKGATSYTGYAEAYSHFGELVKAKIKFNNVKPTNPLKLSFEARYLWVPALHSATTVMTMRLFPGSLLCLAGLLAGTLIFKRSRRHFKLKILPYAYLPLLLFLSAFIIYIYMVRYHVFAILFSCIVIPLLARCMVESARRIKMGYSIVGLLMMLCFWAEIEKGLQLERVYPEKMLRATSELIRWFRTQKLSDRVILARMTLSPLLKDYCGAVIVLQPKFELKKTRDLVKMYIWIMYHGNEKMLAQFCMAHKIEFVVFAKGDGFGDMHKFSLPYMAVAKKVNKLAPAYLLKNQPGALKYFYQIQPPADCKALSDQYMVYRFVHPGNHAKAKKFAELALYYYKQGNSTMARKLAQASFLLAPNSKQAYIAWFHIFGSIPKPQLRDFPKLNK
jgi:Q-cell neuroblast polarization protein